MELEPHKTEQRKPRRDVSPGRWDLQTVIVSVLAYGGSVAVAAAILVAVTRAQPVAPPAPAVPLDLSAGALSTGERVLPPPPPPEPAPPRRPEEEPARSDTEPPAEPPQAAPTDAPPSPAATAAAPPAAPDGCRAYPVLPGDASRTVARRLSRTVEQLRGWNPDLGSRPLTAGETLRVCDTAPSIVGWRERQVTVAAGETVLVIARRANLSIENVVAANGIDPNRIFKGQALTVFDPVWDPAPPP